MADKTTYKLSISNPKLQGSAPIEIEIEGTKTLGNIFATLTPIVNDALEEAKKSPEGDSIALAWWGDWKLKYKRSGKTETAQKDQTVATLCNNSDNNTFELEHVRENGADTGHFLSFNVFSKLTEAGQEKIRELQTAQLEDPARPNGLKHLRAAMKTADDAALKTAADDGDKPTTEADYSRYRKTPWWRTPIAADNGDKPTTKADYLRYRKPLRWRTPTAAAMGHVIQTEY